MNQGKIWTVVHPTVGLPLLLGSVTVIALLVHASLLNNTSWFAGYWEGAAATSVAAAPASTVVASANTGTVQAN